MEEWEGGRGEHEGEGTDGKGGRGKGRGVEKVGREMREDIGVEGVGKGSGGQEGEM